MHSGKTTAAKLYQQFMLENYGIEVPRVSFAKELKRLTMEFICGKLGIEVSEEAFKATDEGRKFFQLVGRIGRNHDENYWVNLAAPEAHAAVHAVVDDLRFFNEERFLREAGFQIVRVWRPEDERKRSVVNGIMKQNNVDLITANAMYDVQMSDPSETEQEGIVSDYMIIGSSEFPTTYDTLENSCNNLFNMFKEN